MSQGLLYNLSVDGINLDWKSLSVRETSTSIDRTSKFNRVGTVNIGFSDTAGDVGTLHLTFDEILGSSDNIENLNYFEAGGEYIDTPIIVSYDSVVIYRMNSFYVDDVEPTGSIPGEARGRVALHSIGPYAKS